MDTPKESAKAAVTKKSASAPEATLLETMQLFDKALANHAQSQSDAQLGLQRRLEDAHQSYTKEMRSASEDVQKRYEDAYRSLAGAVRDALGQEDAQSRIEAAYHQYVEAMRGTAEDVQTRAGGAYRDYLAAIQSGQVAGQQSSYDGYRNYLLALQEAWAKVDVDAVVDAAAKGLIGQGT
jgi:hypothetical protein